MRSTKKQHFFKPILRVLVMLMLMYFGKLRAYASVPEDDRYIDREYASPGGHQLASWLISQLRRGEYPASHRQEVPPYRIPIAAGTVSTTKRNSELTSSIMGIPRTMMDNGR